MFASLLFVVSLPPSIIIHPMGERILKGSNYTLMCSASGSGILTYGTLHKKGCEGCESKCEGLRVAIS